MFLLGNSLRCCLLCLPDPKGKMLLKCCFAAGPVMLLGDVVGLAIPFAPYCDTTSCSTTHLRPPSIALSVSCWDGAAFNTMEHPSGKSAFPPSDPPFLSSCLLQEALVLPLKVHIYIYIYIKYRVSAAMPATAARPGCIWGCAQPRLNK